MVRMTVFPASSGAAAYTGAKVDAPEMIEPAPSSVQEMMPFDADAPITVAVWFSQMTDSPPADAVGGAKNVRTFVSDTDAHGAFPNAVRVNSTLPASKSAWLGIYSTSESDVEFTKVPVPEDDHSTDSNDDADTPVEITTDPASAQTSTGSPASAMGSSTTVMVKVSDTGGHPRFDTVAVKVTVFPESPGAGV